jgi:hypothetical protein
VHRSDACAILLLFLTDQNDAAAAAAAAAASNIYYINDHLDKRTWTYIFGACCALTVFMPSFHNYRIWSFLGLAMTTYTAWYLTIAAISHGQVTPVVHTLQMMMMTTVVMVMMRC